MWPTMEQTMELSPTRISLPAGIVLTEHLEAGNITRQFVGDAGLPLFPETGPRVIQKVQDVFLSSLHGHAPEESKA